MTDDPARRREEFRQQHVRRIRLLAEADRRRAEQYRPPYFVTNSPAGVTLTWLGDDDQVIARSLDIALAWAESDSAPVDARVLAEEVRAMHVLVKALETERERQTRAQEWLRYSVLRALRAEGADPVEAASFVREVADKLAARVAQLEPFLAVVPCPNPTEHEGRAG